MGKLFVVMFVVLVLISTKPLLAFVVFPSPHNYGIEAATKMASLSPEIFKKAESFVMERYPGFRSYDKWIATEFGFVKRFLKEEKSISDFYIFSLSISMEKWIKMFLYWDGTFAIGSSSDARDAARLDKVLLSGFWVDWSK